MQGLIHIKSYHRNEGIFFLQKFKVKENLKTKESSYQYLLIPGRQTWPSSGSLWVVSEFPEECEPWEIRVLLFSDWDVQFKLPFPFACWKSISALWIFKLKNKHFEG